MAKYAVIRSGGKQIKVGEGDTILVEKLPLKPKDKHTFSNVLLVVEESAKKVGTPLVAGVVVTATVIGDKKMKKIRVAKFKAKAKYRRVTGHRKVMTEVKIDEISTSKTVKSEKQAQKA